MTDNDRPRGVMAYPLPAEATGPLNSYALVLNTQGETRVVHTEGVAYLVTDEKPWTWNDYDPSAPRFTPAQLKEFASVVDAIDLADWVRSFGARLESNFHQVHWWATEEEES